MNVFMEDPFCRRALHSIPRAAMYPPAAHLPAVARYSLSTARFDANVRERMIRSFGGAGSANTSSVSFSLIGSVLPPTVSTRSLPAKIETRRLALPIVPSSTHAPRESCASRIWRTRDSRFDADAGRVSDHGDNPRSTGGRFGVAGSAR